MTVELKLDENAVIKTGGENEIVQYTGQQYCCISLANQSIVDGDIEDVQNYLRWNYVDSKIAPCSSDDGPVSVQFENIDSLSGYIVMVEFLSSPNSFTLSLTMHEDFVCQ